MSHPSDLIKCRAQLLIDQWPNPLVNILIPLFFEKRSPNKKSLFPRIRRNLYLLGGYGRTLLTSIILVTSIFFIAHTANAKATFAPPVDYDLQADGFGIGVVFQALASGDLNGDGFPDVVLNTNDGVAVLMNKGNGELAKTVVYGLNGSPGTSLIVRDFNSDSHLDLALSVSRQMAVLLNRGDGTFVAPVYYAGELGGPIAAGDFFRDGHIHLVKLGLTSTGGSGQLVVYRNRGDGSFTTGQVLNIPEGGVALTASDVNGDSYPDLISNVGTNDVLVFNNKKDGTFAPSRSFPTGKTGAAAVADLDKDGLPDIALPNFNGSVSVLLNDGHGSFLLPIYYPTGLTYAISATAADLDGDGNVDIAPVSISDPGYFSILTHKGDGTFESSDPSLTDGAIGNQIIAVDLNRDGQLDLVASFYEQNPPKTHVAVFKNLTTPVQSKLHIDLAMPDHGGNAGNLTTRIIGGGFQCGATVKLTGIGANIAGSNVNVIGSGSLTVTFNLTGATPGIRNIVVTNPDGTSTPLANGFTIEQGGATDVYVDLIGPIFLRGGAARTYYLSVGNRGNVDAHLVRFWITFPNLLTWSQGQGPRPSSSGEISGVTFLAFDVPLIAAGSTEVIPVKLTGPNTFDFAHRSFEIQAWKDINPSPSSAN